MYALQSTAASSRAAVRATPAARKAPFLGCALPKVKAQARKTGLPKAPSHKLLCPRASLPASSYNFSPEPSRNTSDGLVKTLTKGFAKAAAVGALATALILGSSGASHAAGSSGRVGGTAGFRNTSTTTVVNKTTIVRQSSPAPMFGMGFFGIVPVVPVYGYGMPVYVGGFLKVFLIALLVLLVIAAVRAMMAPRNDDVVEETTYIVEEEEYIDHPPVTVAKLQVGLLAIAKEIKANLDRVAVSTDTSTPEGLHYLLQETVLSLMRNPSYAIYAHTGGEIVYDNDQAEQRFNQMSLQERSKFREETLVNLNGAKTSGSLDSSSSPSGVQEMVVVTILVAAEGKLELPRVNTLDDLKLALSMIGGLSAKQVLAVELMWTPQADNDYYTRDQILTDYPQLVPVM